MKKLFITCFILGGLLTPFLLAKKKFWEEKPFTEWTEEEVTKLFQKSPWAKLETFVDIRYSGQSRGAGGPGGSGGGLGTGGGQSGVELGGTGQQGGRSPTGRSGMPPVEVQFLWVSYPMLQGLARLSQIDEKLSDEQVMRRVQPNQDTIEFYIRGRGLGMLVRPGEHAIEIEEKSYLKKKNGEKIPISKITFGNNFLTNPLIILQFPKEVGGKPIITLDDKDVRLEVQLGKRRFKPKFKLKDMVVRGVLMI